MKSLLEQVSASAPILIFKVHSIAVFVMEYASVRSCSELIT